LRSYRLESGRRFAASLSVAKCQEQTSCTACAVGGHDDR
jgi:hypothetical protein